MVPRPASGSAGDGFNLQAAMGLADDGPEYRAIRRGVRHLAAAAQLDHRLHWRHQDKSKIGRLFRVARHRHPYLARFVNDWATEEFVKGHLKNRRAYYARMHYDDNVDAMQVAGPDA